MRLLFGVTLMVAAFIAIGVEFVVYVASPIMGTPFLVGAFATACLLGGLSLLVS